MKQNEEEEKLNQIRLKNLKTLMGAERATVSSFAKMVNMSRPRLSTIINGSSPMSSKYARKIESVMQQPLGWMDRDNHGPVIALYDAKVLHRALSVIYSSDDTLKAYNNMSIQAKAALLDKFYMLFTDPELYALSDDALHHLLGVVDNEQQVK